ncbi:MAG TPA: DUF4185 domain-containing protein [Polyangiaceae bacterium]|nr:DUF4185 domain-containing protein [Polyangiaceae bacterium]
MRIARLRAEERFAASRRQLCSPRARYGRLVAATFALSMAGCAPDGPAWHAEPWPEANALFTNDPRWIGGDGAYTVDLGRGRILWLFGDSFIALSSERRRDDSYMVRNSVAIQTGCDPSTAFMRFYYRTLERHPQSFIPEDGKFWFWPGHGVRIGDRALLFYGRVFQEGEGMWGFSSGSWTAFVVENPDDEPIAWRYREARTAADTEVQLGGAVLPIGDWLYVYGNGTGRHPIYLARFDTQRAMQGDLTSPEWWNGEGWGGSREALIEIGAPEYSVHRVPGTTTFAFTQTAGFGASTLAVRTANALEGPWSAPRDIIRPPESFLPEPFVYAGKAHPELCGADVAVTYVPSGFDTSPPDPKELYYYPRFVRVSYQ